MSAETATADAGCPDIPRAHADADGSYDAICNRGDLTRRQLLIWAGDRLADGAPVFVEAGLFDLRGPLDADRFARAFRAVVEESDALATTVVEVDGWPRRVDAGRSAPAIERVDLSRSPAPARALEDLARERVWSCGTAAGALVDAVLARIAPEHHVWLLVQHQLVSDSWSFQLVHERLLAHYRDEPAVTLPPQFREYVAYERRVRESPRARAARAHWERCYGGAAGHGDQVGGGGLGATRVCRIVRPLGGPRTRALRALAVKASSPDFTTFVALASAITAHLHQTGGSDEVVLSVPFSNRPSARFKRTIGSFMNVCPVRLAIEGGERVHALHDRVADATWEAAQHQGWAGRTGPVPQPYDVLVNVHRAAVGADTFDACAMEVRWLAPTHRYGAVAVAVHDFGATGEMTLVVDFNEATFGPASRSEFVGALLRVLDAQLSDPTRRLADLAAGASRAGRVVTPEVDAGAGIVWERFVAQARLTPAAVAVRAGASSRTYGALCAGARHVAERLVGHGVERDAIVAVWGARGLAWVEAMLGVWCRGAVYLPLDPRWPAARIAQVLRQSGTRTVLVGMEPPAMLQALQAADASWTILPIAPGATSSGGDASADSSGAAEDLAYVIYTSGSTGTPKGALIEHRGLQNHLAAKIALLGLGVADRVAQTAAASFDVSLWQCLAPLLVGGQVEILDDAVTRDPVALRAAVAESKLTVLELVPTMLELLLDADATHAPALGSLRWVVATGEALPPALCRRWLGRYPTIPVVNAYGPTECADDVTHHVVRMPPSAEVVRVPIGDPIPGMAVHVLDAELRAVAAGEVGELCVSGVGVGRGYLHDAERTAAAFVGPDRFDGGAGARLYRTGDLGRRRADGAFEWLGRRDLQVKVHGVRIELEEIEAVLCEHPDVRQAAVGVRADATGDRRLTAYVVLRNDAPGGACPDHLRDAEQLGEWRRLWDDTYRRTSTLSVVPSFNTAGWTSSYTRQPISDVEMREWLDATVDRVLALGPRRALEIGCGSGMLLSRVAPRCERYFALDLSPAAVDYVHRELMAGGALPHVSVRQGAAHELASFDGHPVDTIILNSVAQYFPSVGYLARVLGAACDVLDERGAVFVGDVRALGSARALHTSVELARAPEHATVAELRAAIERGLVREGELLVDPAFFAELGRMQTRPSSVVVQLKRGRCHNELTRFRYDVVWRMGAVEEQAPAEELLWDDGLSPAALRAIIAADAESSVAIRGVPNARLQREHGAVDLVAAAPGEATVAELRRALAARNFGAALDPEDVWAMENPAARAVAITWSAIAPDRYDVVLSPRRVLIGSARRRLGTSVGPLAADAATRWQGYANDPRRRDAVASRLEDLRAFVRARLPEAMQPSHFVTLDALPLTANGKVARDGLPEAGIVETSASDESAPRSGIEAVVAEIWRRMLGVHTVGRDDDFFALGGDSLLVYRMLLAVRAARAVEVPAEAFLQCPTVAGLAQAIDTLPLGDLADADVETLLAEVETLSEVEAAALLGAVDDREGRAAERGDA